MEFLCLGKQILGEQTEDLEPGAVIWGWTNTSGFDFKIKEARYEKFGDCDLGCVVIGSDFLLCRPAAAASLAAHNQTSSLL